MRQPDKSVPTVDPGETASVPAVSVLVDVSTGADYLDQALHSLARQTFPDFEIVLLAHGADAATGAVVRKWELAEPRIRAFRSPKLALAEAHNRTAREARAPLLARLDADDLAKPGRLEQQVRRFADPALGFLGCAVEIIDAANTRKSVLRNPLGHPAIVAALPRSCPIVHSTLMVRTELFWCAGGYRQGLNISEDYDLYMRLAELTRGGNLVEPLVAHRIHKHSLTGQRTLAMAIANEAVRCARLARIAGLPEPFINGVPSLRQTAEVLGASQSVVRRRIRATTRQAGLSRRLLTGWLPLRHSGWARSLAIRLGLRPVYSTGFLLVEIIGKFVGGRSR